MGEEMKLPASLSVSPNLKHEDMTLEQLVEERDYWDEKIKVAPSWGASLVVADGFRRDCQKWIDRKTTNMKAMG